MEEKKQSIIVLAIVVLLTANLNADIIDVTIQPETPTMADILSITVSGLEGSTAVQITDALVEFEDDLITLDIYLNIGSLALVSPWSHTQEIGPLLQGTYELTVNSICLSKPIHNDTYLQSFEVTPEPATLLLLGLGAVVLRKRRAT